MKAAEANLDNERHTKWNIHNLNEVDGIRRRPKGSIVEVVLNNERLTN